MCEGAEVLFSGVGGRGRLLAELPSLFQRGLRTLKLATPGFQRARLPQQLNLAASVCEAQLRISFL